MTNKTEIDAGAERLSEQLREIAEQVLTDARTQGATAAEVHCSGNRGLTSTVRNGEVETLEFANDRGVSINVYFGKRKGAATTADLDPASIALSLEQACAIARFTEEDDCAGLADRDRLATEFPDLDLWQPWDLTPEQAIEIGKATEAAARENSAITNSEGATVNSHSGVTVYANSHGFMGEQQGTRHSISCVVIAGSGDGMQRDYDYDVARAADDLRSAAAIGRRAAERTAARSGARKARTGRVPVLFAPEVARGLLGHLIGAAKGGALYRQASFLLDQLNQPVMHAAYGLRERPHVRRGLGSCAFDAEGVATTEHDIVADGVLRSYVLSSYSARKLGLASTGNAGGVHNVELMGPTVAVDELRGSIRDGLLVTEVMGQGVNLVTGDYSRGASGFWIRDGAVAEPVQEVTIAGNLRDMLMQISGAGADIDRRGNIHCGSLLIDGMMVAGE